MSTDHPTMQILEEDVPFSTCALWRWHRSFYEREGVHAWSGQVPFYVTSNAYIANSYASVIAALLRDCAELPDRRPLEPFYIVECGAGSGRFAYHTIRRLTELLEALRMTDTPFVYVMTDFAERNVSHWREHPAFRDHVARGALDFALLDADAPGDLKLLCSGEVLSAEGANPLIVIANYFFDAVPHAAFRISAGKLQEGRVRLSTDTDNLRGGEPADLGKVKIDFSYRDLEAPYGDDDDVRAVLESYEPGTEGCFTLPVGGFRVLRKLMEISGNRLVLLATDKAYSRAFELTGRGDPEIAFHGGSCSLAVNFHAIGQYFRQRGGEHRHQTTLQAISTSAFSMGLRFDELPQMREAIASHFDAFGPGNLFTLHTHIERTIAQCSLAEVVAHFEMLRWDPHLLDRNLDVIVQMLKASHPSSVRDLLSGLHRMAEHFYYTPGSPNTLANIGTLFQRFEDHDVALHYYEKSLRYFGKTEGAFYNMGLCHLAKGERARAIESFEAVLALNRRHILARGWLSQIHTEATQA